MIIGICGKSGSGKSTLAKTIMENHSNSIHLDIDKIGHYVLGIPLVKEELSNTFGNSILNENNVDRKKLGNIVFNSRREMQKLTNITWKYMQIEIDRFLEENKDKIVILDWILLPRTKYFKMCDIRILLDVPLEVREKRALKRDNISKEAFSLREQASIEYDKKDFDYVFIDSSGEDVKRLVKSL